MNIHIDKNIGVSSNKIHWMISSCGKRHWCRMAISIMGSFNMSEKELEKISPFDPKFYDNYVEGKGYSKKEAYENIQKQMNEISESLWF